MLIRQGAARSSSNDRRLACTLAAAAGALNTAAFQAVGFFSANMTGNVSSLSDHAALGQWLIGAFYLTIVLAFIGGAAVRSEEHTSELQSLMRISYAVFCLKKKKKQKR